MYQNRCKGKQNLRKSGIFADKFTKIYSVMNKRKTAKQLLDNIFVAPSVC